MSDESTGAEPQVELPLSGRVIGGKYRVRKLIARGGMGRIYEAEQLPLGRLVAVKVLHASADTPPDFTRRFLLEASTLAKLRHSNTVTLFDFGHDPELGTHYLVMELVDGRTLTRVLKQGPMQVARALRLGVEIARSLAEAHRIGVVHRDLKPANLMVVNTAEGEGVKVLDFGIAKLVAGVGVEDVEATRADRVVGSPRYMAPEQIRAEAVDGRTDVYALAVILWEAIAGRPLYDAPNHQDVLASHLRDPVPSLPDGKAPPEVEALLRSCLSKRPDDRPASIEIVLGALRGLLAAIDSPGATGPLTPIALPAPRNETTFVMEPPSEPEGSARRWIGVVAAVALVGAAAAWWAAGTAQPVAPTVIAAPKVATWPVRVTSEPSGAEVLVDGEVVGRTPVELERPAGEARGFVVRLRGYEDVTVRTTGAGDEVLHALMVPERRPALPAPVAVPAARPAVKRTAPSEDLMMER